MKPLDELTFTPAWRIAELIRNQEISTVEMTEHFLARIEELNPKLNAYITVCPEQALASARAAEKAILENEEIGPLHGVPISIKDLNPTRGIRTTRGSLIYKDWIPDEDDMMSERVRLAGAVILGKTNTPEFGARGTTENYLGDACRNPWNTERTAGGSSGGAAAALAAGLCSIATGSDAGGSIRIPGSFCGVYGIRPSQGRVPRLYSGIGGWTPFSQNGPIAHTVRDAAILLQVMAGPDPRDPTCLQGTPPNFEQATFNADVKGMRIAWSPDLGYAPVDPDVRKTCEQSAHLFAQFGANVEEANPPIEGDKALNIFRTMWHADHSAEFGHLLDSSAHLLTDYFRIGLEMGVRVQGRHLAQALRDREWHRAKLDNFFRSYDLLLTPSTAVTAFPIEQFPSIIGERQVDPGWGFSPFTYPFNISGQPAATVPCGFSSQGLPIGFQIVGRRGEETTVLRASAAFESAKPWQNRHPPIS